MAVVWLNGALVAEEAATVSLFDRGYLYGDGLFETMRAYDGRVFRLRQHYERICTGARLIDMRVPFEFDALTVMVAEVLRANTLHNAYLRLTVSRGVGLGPLPPESVAPTVSLIASPLQPPSPQEYLRGWRAIIVAGSLAPDAPFSRLKPLSYLDKLLAKIAARDAGVQEALLLNCRGEISEASTSNLFIVTAGRVVTPPERAGLLAGIARAAVLDCAGRLGIEAAEERVTPDIIATGDECFLTNSIIEVMPLVEVAGRPVGSDRAGEITRALHSAYRAEVAREAHGGTGCG